MDGSAEIAPDQWQAAVREAGAILAAVAREGGLITYAGLARRLRSVILAPGDATLARLLREVSTGDHAAGRGMRSALVVFKHRGRPGAGFFDSKRRLASLNMGRPF